MADNTKVWMPIYIGDLLADTLHLTPAEFGAYHLFMYHQWRKGPVPERSLRSVCRMSEEEWGESESTIKAFLTEEDGCWYQKRTALEKCKSDALSARNQENGKRGGRPRNNPENPDETQTKPRNNPDVTQNETQTLTPSPSPSHKYKSKNKPQQAQAPFVLPEWIDRTAWNGFEAMRLKLRRGLTEQGRSLCVKKLESLQRVGNDPTEVLNQSTMNSWQGLFEVKGGGNGITQQNRGNQRVADQLAELAKAGVTFADRGPEAGTGEVCPAAGGSSGRASPGVVLEGAR